MHAPGKALMAATAVLAVTLACTGCTPSATGGGAAPAPTAPTATATAAPRSPEGDAANACRRPDGGSGTDARRSSPTANRLPSSPAGTPSRRGTGPGILVTVPSGWVGNWKLVGKDYWGLRSRRAGPVRVALRSRVQGPVFRPHARPAGRGNRGRRAPSGHRRPAGHPGGADLGRDHRRSPGKFVDYTVTADPATCGDGQDGFWIWGTCPVPVTPGCEDAAGGDSRWGVSKGDARACVRDRRRRQHLHVLHR